jgi:hypothetical protein
MWPAMTMHPATSQTSPLATAASHPARAIARPAVAIQNSMWRSCLNREGTAHLAKRASLMAATAGHVRAGCLRVPTGHPARRRCHAKACATGCHGEAAHRARGERSCPESPLQGQLRCGVASDHPQIPAGEMAQRPHARRLLQPAAGSLAAHNPTARRARELAYSCSPSTTRPFSFTSHSTASQLSPVEQCGSNRIALEKTGPSTSTLADN